MADETPLPVPLRSPTLYKKSVGNNLSGRMKRGRRDVEKRCHRARQDQELPGAGTYDYCAGDV